MLTPAVHPGRMPRHGPVPRSDEAVSFSLSSADISPVAASGSSASMMTIQPSPYGSLLTSSGLDSSDSLRSTIVPDSGA